MLEFDFFPKAPEVEKVNRKGHIPPKTSIDANNSVKDMKEEHYKKIIRALEELKVGAIYTEIADKCGLDPIAVARRLSELVTAGIVYNVGTTRKTPQGRNSMIRQLTSFKTQ